MRAVGAFARIGVPRQGKWSGWGDWLRETLGELMLKIAFVHSELYVFCSKVPFVVKTYKLTDHPSALVSLHKVMIGSGPTPPYLVVRRRYRVNSEVFAECFTGISLRVS